MVRVVKDGKEKEAPLPPQALARRFQNGVLGRLPGIGAPGTRESGAESANLFLCCDVVRGLSGPADVGQEAHQELGGLRLSRTTFSTNEDGLASAFRWEIKGQRKKFKEVDV